VSAPRPQWRSAASRARTRLRFSFCFARRVGCRALRAAVVWGRFFGRCAGMPLSIPSALISSSTSGQWTPWPSPMSCQLARWAGVASDSRHDHARGTLRGGAAEGQAQNGPVCVCWQAARGAGCGCPAGRHPGALVGADGRGGRRPHWRGKARAHTQANGPPQRVADAGVGHAGWGTIGLAIPRVPVGSYFPSLPPPHRFAELALWRWCRRAGTVPTRTLYELMKALGARRVPEGADLRRARPAGLTRSLHARSPPSFPTCENKT